MTTAPARPVRDDHPPSTSGTSTRRARRWPLGVGLLADGRHRVEVARDPDPAQRVGPDR